MKYASFAPCAILALLLSVPAHAQVRQHDPLTADEVDQLRDVTQEPEQRIKLLIQFAHDRLAPLDKPLSATDSTSRGQEVHDHIEDFVAIYDEIDDNLAMFVDHKEDLRKPLRQLIAADEEFAARFRHMREQADSPTATSALRTESQEYGFVLTNAIEAVGTGLTDHRKLLQDQEEEMKDRKKRK